MSLTLKEQLEAKKLAAPEVVDSKQDPAIPSEAPAESLPETAQQPINPQFRKSTFAFQFKYGKGTIKCDKMGVYTPKNEEEFEYLKHQVLVGNILFN